MKTYTEDEVLDMIADDVGRYDVDSDGRVVINTPFYKWKDGTFHDAPQSRMRKDKNGKVEIVDKTGTVIGKQG